MQQFLKFILAAVATGVIGYIGWTIYAEGTRSASATMSESVYMAQNQARNMEMELTSVGTVGRSAKSKAIILETGRVSEITDLNALLVEWRPSYASAKLAHAKFAASIANAKSQAADYFAQQQALTESMHDPENRVRAEQEDTAEMLLYRQWEARADAALKTATEIGYRLDDMDANLKKMELRADFVFDSSAFLEVPEDVLDLNRQLADFHTSSENIKAISGSPFDAQMR